MEEAIWKAHMLLTVPSKVLYFPLKVRPSGILDKYPDIHKRTLRQITVEDAVRADEVFSKLMGEEVEPRREFIETNATYANLDI